MLDSSIITPSCKGCSKTLEIMLEARKNGSNDWIGSVVQIRMGKKSVVKLDQIKVFQEKKSVWYKHPKCWYCQKCGFTFDNNHDFY